jgi:hypothetical protein
MSFARRSARTARTRPGSARRPAPRGTAGARPGRRCGGCRTSRSLAEGRAVHRRQRGVEQAGARQFAEDGDDAAGAVHVFDVVLVRHRRHLAQAGHLARDAVDVGHREFDARLRGRRPAGAARCWWSRPSRRPAPSRSRRRPWWRCCAAGPSNRPARSGAWPVRRSGGRRAGTVPCGRRGWRGWCRCPAAPGPAPRSGSSSSSR